MIVTLRGMKDVERTKERISKISGVTGTDYSYLTQKLRVKYEGDRARLQEIESQTKKALQSKQRSGL